MGQGRARRQVADRVEVLSGPPLAIDGHQAVVGHRGSGPVDGHRVGVGAPPDHHADAVRGQRDRVGPVGSTGRRSGDDEPVVVEADGTVSDAEADAQVSQAPLDLA